MLWPNLIRSTRLGTLDRYGIDLCTAEEPLMHSVAIQAKGFKIEDNLTISQVEKQILPSINKFKASPVQCETYIIIHNRHGDDSYLREKIESELSSLIDNQSARFTYLWDLSKTLKELKTGIDKTVRNKLRERSQAILDENNSMFYYSSSYIDKVPASVSEWQTNSRTPPQKNSRFLDQSASKLISSSSSARYSLLIGSFGIGKTTTVLHATSNKDLDLIYIRASSILREAGSQGTNFLMLNVGKTLDLFDHLPMDTATVLEPVIGAVLGRILRQPDDRFAVLIDGLDEHPFYSSAKGLQWLTNELSELRCPIVLTTRTEHFEHLLGNYRIAMDSLSKKGGARRPIRVVELGQWSTKNALNFLQLVESNAKSKHKESITALLKKIDENSKGPYIRNYTSLSPIVF